MITSDRLWRVLSYSWWILFPAFLLLVARFSYERACMDPYELLRPLMRQQSLALAIAATYVGAHVWLVTVVLLVARMVSSGHGARGWAVSVDVKEVIKILAMAAALALEQMPRAVWAWLYHVLGVC